MKQVQLWIAVCPFNNEITWNVKDWKDMDDKTRQWYCFKIRDKILIPKVENHDEYVENLDEDMFLKPNETYKSVLQALWDYQKSLLPDGYKMYNYMINDGIVILHGKDFRSGSTEFYNPETRIITITDFEQEADDDIN